MNILMINQGQFGYNAGYYHYCKHLSAQGHRIVEKNGIGLGYAYLCR